MYYLIVIFIKKYILINIIIFLRYLKIVSGLDNKIILPIYWDDNYFTLFPSESFTVKAIYTSNNYRGGTPVVKIEHFNKDNYNNI